MYPQSPSKSGVRRANSGRNEVAPGAAFLLKEFDLGSKPLEKPVIRVYWAGSEAAQAERDRPAPYRELLPVRERERYGHAYLNGFGKDPLYMHVRGEKKRMVRFLVSDRELDEIAFFCPAAWEPSRLRVSVAGRRAREMTISPGGHNALVIRARRCYPFTGYHYRIIVEGDGRSNCLVRIATDPRDIGRMFLSLGDIRQAAAYLEKAVRQGPQDEETYLMLAETYAQLRKPFRTMETMAEGLAGALLRDNFAAIISGEDKQPKMPVTSLLKSLVARRFETEELDSRHFRDSERTDSCLSHRAEAPEDEVFLSGPYYPVPPGSYEAVFHLRARRTGAAEGILRLEVTSEEGSRVLAQRKLAAADLGPAFRDITLSFDTDSWHEGLEFRARALGSADICIDRITLVPKAPGPH